MTAPSGGARSDEGSVMLLVLGLTVVLATLIAVVVDTGRLYLERRSLDAVTDAAALAGSQAIDLDAVYNGTEGRFLPLDDAGARRAVRRYLDRAEVRAQFDEFDLSSVSVTDDEVTVTTRASVRLPFIGPFTSGGALAVVHSSATARQRTR